MKNFVFIRWLVINSFKIGTVLLGGIGLKKFQAFFHKVFNENVINKILNM